MGKWGKNFPTYCDDWQMFKGIFNICLTSLTHLHSGLTVMMVAWTLAYITWIGAGVLLYELIALKGGLGLGQ